MHIAVHHYCGRLVGARVLSAAQGDYQQHRDEIRFVSRWLSCNGFIPKPIDQR